MLLVTNAIPNVFLTRFDKCQIEKLTLCEVKDLLTTSEWYSIVGHDTTAQKIKQLLDIEVPVNRETVSLEKGDIVVAALVTTPHRLKEGELWSPEKLVEMPIEFLKLTFGG